VSKVERKRMGDHGHLLFPAFLKLSSTYYKLGFVCHPGKLHILSNV